MFYSKSKFLNWENRFDYTLSYDEYSAKYIKTENSLEINKGNDYQLFCQRMKEQLNMKIIM